MRKLFFPFILVSILLAGCQTVPYKQAADNWKTHEDVAKWLQSNFTFDKDRQRTITKRLREQGPDGLLVRNPQKVYEYGSGYCVDSANFALHHLNQIDNKYNARWVFVENNMGRPNHWVTAFDFKGKLYIMDYGTGDKWAEIQGTHGPYNSLDDYRKYLASRSLPGFEVGDVYFRHMPGTPD